MKEKKNKKEVATKVVENSTTNVAKIDFKSLKSSALVSASGEKSNDVYRKEVYAGCNTLKEKSRYRGKIRKLLVAYMQSFVALANNPNQLATLKKDFDDFYKKIYQVNDYSVNSVLATNAADETKTIVSQGMQVAKKLAEKQA